MSKMNSLFKHTLLFNLVLFSFTAVSQEIEEVVVTATKKAESTQDLAISIEAFTADQLSTEQIYDMTDLAEVVPGLEVAKGVGSGSAWSMRGIGSYGVGAAVVSSMVTSVNGHSTNVSYMNDMGFMDLERIEVLKGPQGTLFGRNSVAGVINLVTNRPSSELEGSFDIERGDWGRETFNAVINVPVSDSIRTRLAVMTNKRDGMVRNTHTGNMMDDRNDMGLRFSMDWDLSDTTQLKLTYSQQASDDNRPQEEVSFCKQDQFYGCSPFERGTPSTAADTRGHIAGVFGFFAALDPGTTQNRYEPTLLDITTNLNKGGNPDFYNLTVDREPTHEQDISVANLELNHDLNDSLKLIVKYSYDNRDFHQMNDNDGSVSRQPLLGAGASLGLPPIVTELCFGGSGSNGFCETVDSDRAYDFSDVSTWSDQSEVNLVSDYDGSFNFTLGAYMFDQRNDNEYRVQTAGTQVMTRMTAHPYVSVLAAPPSVGGFGLDLSGKGGLPFYQALLGWLGTGQVAGFSSAPALEAAAGLLAMPDVNVPWDLGGTINDQHVRIKSKALYGEMYFDLSDKTKLTVGARYNDDSVATLTYNDLAAQSWLARGGPANPDINPHELPGATTYAIVSNDAFAYKLALQHDLSDDVMVYGSYSTAVKAGGTNAGANPDNYDEEKTGVLDIGMKSILMDGAMLLNMNIFRNDNNGMLLATIEDQGSHNYNVDAEITGFEGLMSVFLSETSKLDVSWLLVENEITSDVSAVNYMNPANATGVVAYLGPLDPNGTGAITGAVMDNGISVFKSAGFNCTAPFVFTTGCAAGLAPGAGGTAGVPVSLTGKNLPGTADLSYSIAYTKMFNGSKGMTSARIAYRYRGEANGDPFGMSRFDIPEQKMWDMIVRHEPNDANWYLGFYGKNLADERQLNAIRAASNLQGGQLYGSFTDPRTFGVQFGTSF